MTDKLAYSIDEAAAALSLSRSKVKELVYTRQIKSRKVGSRIIIPRWALDGFLACTESEQPGTDVDWDRMLRDG